MHFVCVIAGLAPYRYVVIIRCCNLQVTDNQHDGLLDLLAQAKTATAPRIERSRG